MYFFALAIFLLTYAVIISEKVHRTITALIGASLLALSGVLSVKDAIHYIDWNTIGLLIGMMIIVGITRNTGVFEYMAVKAAKMVKGNPVKITAALATVTAVVSAVVIVFGRLPGRQRNDYRRLGQCSGSRNGREKRLSNHFYQLYESGLSGDADLRSVKYVLYALLVPLSRVSFHPGYPGVRCCPGSDFNSLNQFLK